MTDCPCVPDGGRQQGEAIQIRHVRSDLLSPACKIQWIERTPPKHLMTNLPAGPLSPPFDFHFVASSLRSSPFSLPVHPSQPAAMLSYACARHPRRRASAGTPEKSPANPEKPRETRCEKCTKREKHDQLAPAIESLTFPLSETLAAFL